MPPFFMSYNLREGWKWSKQGFESPFIPLGKKRRHPRTARTDLVLMTRKGLALTKIQNI